MITPKVLKCMKNNQKNCISSVNLLLGHDLNGVDKAFKFSQ